MNLLNIFLKSKYFDNLNTFVAKKIFKIFKIFFVETKLQKLPDNNYPTVNIKSELEKSKLEILSAFDLNDAAKKIVQAIK